MKTPQLLELSGIGRRDVLERIGVPIKIELPGVGENMQDHSVIGECDWVRGNSHAHPVLQEFRMSLTLRSLTRPLTCSAIPSM